MLCTCVSLYVYMWIYKYKLSRDTIVSRAKRKADHVSIGGPSNREYLILFYTKLCIS